MSEELLPVTKEDREAAASLCARLGQSKSHTDDIREGLCDGIYAVQAFARHRIVALNPGDRT